MADCSVNTFLNMKDLELLCSSVGLVVSEGGRKEKGRERERVTWTMATCKRTPLRPTAREAAAMTAGPVRNLTAMAKAAMEFPHAMILGCKAMNRPVIYTHQKHHQSMPPCHHHHHHPPLSVILLKDLSSSPPPPPINTNMAKK